MKTLHFAIIFIVCGVISIIYTIAGTEYRIWLMRYGGICKPGSSCGGFPVIEPFWIGLGIALMAFGGYFVLKLFRNIKKEIKE